MIEAMVRWNNVSVESAGEHHRITVAAIYLFFYCMLFLTIVKLHVLEMYWRCIHIILSRPQNMFERNYLPFTSLSGIGSLCISNAWLVFKRVRY